MPTTSSIRAVRVPVGDQWLQGDLGMSAEPHGVVLFAHGSGSSRHSPRNQYVARALERRDLATLLIDLLTPEEESVDDRTAQYRFDIPLLAGRLATTVDWLRRRHETAFLPIGLFGASTGGGAALANVTAPTLLIVGGLDAPVIQMNRDAMRQMRAEVTLEIVPGASHLFEESGTLERVAELAGNWFSRYLQPTVSTKPVGPTTV